MAKQSAIVEDDSFEDDSGEESDQESGVQLGVVVPCEGTTSNLLFKGVDWHDWDGGKAGGWPIWLNPRDLPATEAMRCGECEHPLSFLVQLYCPMDHEEDAFHRCLYVFCCPKSSCSKNSSVKAFRCQLPRGNPFYPYEPDDAAERREAFANQPRRLAGSDPSAWGVKICSVCGCLAKSACSKCKQARYCGKEHQTQHWKRGGHKQACGSREAPEKGFDSIMASVFREFEVEVRPEPSRPPPAPDGRTVEEALASQLDLGKADIVGEGEGEDEDAKLSQEELDRIAGVHGVKDEVTLRFLTRCQATPQVVRYDPSGTAPLWSSSKAIPQEADVPPCPRCGRSRRFEFQVMPHLLHHLGIEANANVLDPRAATADGAGLSPPSATHGMDWGTLAVYTCPASCSARNPKGKASTDDGDHEKKRGRASPDSAAVSSYVEEFVWRQPPP